MSDCVSVAWLLMVEAWQLRLGRARAGGAETEPAMRGNHASRCCETEHLDAWKRSTPMLRNEASQCLLAKRAYAPRGGLRREYPGACRRSHDKSLLHSCRLDILPSTRGGPKDGDRMADRFRQ